jgi:hypothetical protein
MDETYVKINGQWYYLYRVIDREGDLVDTMLSQKRDLAAATAFSSKPWMQLVTSLTGSPRTGMTLIHALFVARWAEKLNIAQTVTSTTALSRTIGRSNHATTHAWIPGI